MNQSTYKLTYFDFNGLGESIRWIFKIAGVDFEDERIDLLKDWAGAKDSGRFPLKTLPVLEIDGKLFTQSSAIHRFLGKQFGLESADPMLNFKGDEIVDILTDVRIVFREFIWEPDQEKKADRKRELITNLFPLALTRITTILTERGPFIAGSKLTWPDLVLANWLQIWEERMDPNLIENFPKLQSLREAVYAVPEIKAWREIRPAEKF